MAVIGQRSPAHTWLESCGHSFQPADLKASHARALWCSPGEPWEHVISIRPRIGHVTQTRLSHDVHDAIGWGLRRWPVNDVVIIPLFWREPELVSFNILLALWILSFSPKHRVGRERLDVTFTIASLDSVEPFDFWLRDECRQLRAGISKLIISGTAGGEFALFARFQPTFDQPRFAVAAGAT
jgi:hypothetical protein